MARQNHGLRLVRELFTFAMENKKWWLIPIFIVSLLLVGLVLMTSTPMAPFIYSLF